MILSRQDLADPENVKSCTHELRGLLDNVIDRMDDMATAVRLSDWVAKWGEAIIGQLENPAVSYEDVERAENEATKFEGDIEHLETTINEAIEAMDAASEVPNSEARADAYLAISIDLEKALTK